jgi:GNAT superfamily N-acetyltransferase
MEYLIRNCEENDLTVLVELCQKHAQYEQTSYNPEGKLENLRNAIFSENPKLFCLVIEINENLLGYATYTYDFSTWDAQTFMYMDCLFLDENTRGFGIGEAIIDQLKQIAIDNNCVNIQWQTPIFNARAIKFYKRIGAIGKDKVRFFVDL